MKPFRLAYTLRKPLSYWGMVLVCFLAYGAQAQRTFILSRQDKRGFVNVSTGLSWAVGDFASLSPTNPQAGLAGRGTVTQLSVGFRLTRTTGLMASLSQAQNQTHTEPLIISARLAHPTLSASWKAAADPWLTRALLVGPYTTLPLGRFSADFRVLGGYAVASCPLTLVQHPSADRPVQIFSESQQSQNLAYSVGGTLRYRLGTIVGLQLNADYLQTRSQYNDLPTNTSIGSNRTQTLSSGQKTVSLFNLSAGLTFLFTNRRIL